MNSLLFENLFSGWIGYSFLGMTLLATSMVFFKLPSIREDVDANGLTVWAGFFYLVLASFFFLPHIKVSFTNLVLLVAFAQGTFFTLRTLLQMHGLKYVQTNTLFPTTSTTALLVIVATGILFFGDSLSHMQIAGVFLAVVTLFFFSFKGGKLAFTSSDAIKVWLGIVFLSSVGNLLNKIASGLGDIPTFQFFQYLFIFCSGLFMLLIQKKSKAKKILLSKATMFSGMGMALFGFFGAWALITALSMGPVSVVQTINSSYVIVTATLSSFFFGEIITKKKAILMLSLVAALMLIRLGS